MSEESFSCLLAQLCELQLGSVERAHRVQPSISRQDAKRRLKQTAFDTYFSSLKDRPVLHEDSSNGMDAEIEGILLQVYTLRSLRKYEEADKLERLFNQLKRKDDYIDVRNVLRLLVALRRCGNGTKSSEIPIENVFQFPRSLKQQKLELLPSGPLCYGDVKTRPAFSQFYMHYPEELFNKSFPDIFQEEEKCYSYVFDFSPGQGLGSDSLFPSRLQLKDQHEQRTQQSLFGGLIHGGVTGLDLQLDFPDLSSLPKMRIPEFKCKKSNSSSQLSEESGLGSGSASLSSSVLTIQETITESEPDDFIWEKALTEPRSQHYTWEWIGYRPGPTERPYLTEAGPQIYDILIHLRHRVSAILLTEAETVQLFTVKTSTLVTNILHMLNGVPSKLFPFNKDTLSFDIMKGLHMVGMSSEILADFLLDFVKTGTSYVRLLRFSRPPILNSFYNSGLIFQAFVIAIRRALNYYSAEIISCSCDLQLVELNVYFHKTMAQIGYLAKFCKCDEQKPPSVPPGDFPVGMELLSYVYNETMVSVSSPHYPLLLYILQTTSSPFMLFIKDWVFHGVFTDCYQEFMIYSHDKSVEARDEKYWEKAYTLAIEGQGQCQVPQYLQDTVDDIVTCGKAINLIRICNPQHFLCNVSDSELPSVVMTFSQSDLRVGEQYCQAYVGRMKEVARQITGDRRDLLKRIEQSKLDLQQTARNMADQEIARLQGIIDKRKLKADALKRVEFDRLKNQMEVDLKRRGEDVEKERKEDRDFMAKLNRDVDALTEQEIELEKKARDDLIAYYTELGEEAMHRERLALWRVQRAQLSTAREAFLEADQSRWLLEMKEAQQGKIILDSVTPLNIPSWVERTLNESGPVEVGDKEEIILPSWVGKEVVDLKTLEDENIVEGDVLEGETIPKWAARVLEKGGTILEVGSDDDNGKEGGSLSFVDNSDEEVDGKLERDHNSRETSGQLVKANTQSVAGRHISDCSEETDKTSKSGIRMLRGITALTETVELEINAHVKISDKMFATKESDHDLSKQKLHLKFQEGVQVNQESIEERQLIPRRQHNGLEAHHITSETKSQDWVIKKPNLFGHASQLSNSEYILQVPRLRQQTSQQSNTESRSFKDFGIKPRVRMNATMWATKETDVTDDKPARPHIRIQPGRSVNTESELVDENAVAIKRFKERNVKGHASDSTLQQLMYGGGHAQAQQEQLGPLPRIELKPGPSHQLECYETEFPQFESCLTVDLMANIFVSGLRRGLVDDVTEEEVEAYKYTPLSVLLTRSITTPIRAQISLVNTAVINYFTSELKVDDHFAAIRRYLLMADGDFAEILSNILFEKLSSNPLPQGLLNVLFLNGTLNKAICSSIHSGDEYTKNLSFALKFMPSVLLHNDPNSLKCLELQYIVGWPLNIVLTSSCMEKYYQVFSFLLQIKRVVWVLKDVWHRLKRDALISKVGNSRQFRHIQLHRQEMEHFVKMMQGYITNQVIHVSWQELQVALAQPIEGLDQLTKIHQQYVERAVCRCLLDKKAIKVMKVIKDIFCLILKFRSQLVSASWQQTDTKGQFIHPNFSSILTTYKTFHVHSFFLFKVLNRLSQKGYQPHLQDLLLQLNFNDYYTEAAN